MKNKKSFTNGASKTVKKVYYKNGIRQKMEN